MLDFKVVYSYLPDNKKPSKLYASRVFVYCQILSDSQMVPVVGLEPTRF